MTLIRPESIAALKARVPLLTVVERLVALRGAGDDFRGLCPFHSEKSPSFHVHPERGFFKCFGCGVAGDVLGFVQRSEGLSFTQAAEALSSRFGIALEYEDGHSAIGTPIPTRPAPAPAPAKPRPRSEAWLRLQPHLRTPTLSEVIRIADSRGVAMAAVEYAIRHGQLFTAPVFDGGTEHPAWIITDSSRRNAQARRLDGLPWSGIKAKAKTIAGSEASYPIGLADATLPGIALVEGGPDFLAAWHLIFWSEVFQRVRPVSILGASQSIPADALPHFSGRDIWIYPHSDENHAGEIAAERWRESLLPFAHTVTIVPPGAKDLNDAVLAMVHEDEE